MTNTWPAYTEPYQPQSFSKNATTDLKDPWLFNATFVLDSGDIPYNSSLMFGNKTYPLHAPLLRFGPANGSSMLSYMTNADNLCFGSTVIPQSDFTLDNLRCISQSYFVWGFSKLLLSIGVMLQILWTTALYGMWLFVGWKSETHRFGRRLQGRLRATADVAGVLSTELGEDIGAYEQARLVKEMDGKEVAWVLEEDDKDEVVRLRVSARRDKRERIVLEEGRLYS